MRHPLVLMLPFFFAAARSLTLGIQSPSRLGSRPTISAEAEYKLPTIITFCLLGLLIALCLMVRFPEFGTVIAEYNQF
jgi:hypothetical protein